MNPIMKYFEYKHLPDNLQAVSKRFYALAVALNETVDESPDKSAGLRKLLEAKD